MKKYLFLILVLFIPYGANAQQMQQSPAPTQTTVASRQRDTNFCDPNYVGESLNFSMTAELRLDDLVYQIHKRFGVNFLMGDGIKDLPINIRSGGIPWNTLLNSQLFLSGVRAKCIGNNTIELVKNSELKSLQDTQQVTTKFIKLKFLQPTTGGTVDLAGRSSGNQNGSSGQNCQQGGQGGGQGGGSTQGCGNFEKLIIEIEKILGIRSATSSVGGGGGGNTQDNEPKRTNRSVSQIPGRNILVVRGTDEEMELINQIIERADRPPFQIIVKGLVYTANIDRLRDIGVQTNIIASTADGRTSGTIIGNPISGAGTLFDFSSLIGTVEFNVQASALQQNGVISIKARPFAIVLDGDQTELEVGRQIPVLTQGSVVGGNAGNLEFIGATNKLSVTPHVIDDDNGNPIAVNLELLLQSNEVDVSVISQGIPTVNERSIQSRLILSQDKTVILGGFTVDSTNDSVSKTPGLGDIPILGYLFKRKVRSDQINRLYFALSVTVVPYGDLLEPVKVPGATTDVPTVQPVVTKSEKKLEKKEQ
ncbi:MAG TPA: hypothetical protein VNB22_07040 [Pyrinomonadaceae bacterium]|jgi:type II secretory pathway component GspD/PulD (secretin)|nr:hypothetical protein [Pyrinomonadaceae bacterium]